MGEINLEVLSLEELSYLYDEFNVTCIIANGHVVELVSGK